MKRHQALGYFSELRGKHQMAHLRHAHIFLPHIQLSFCKRPQWCVSRNATKYSETMQNDLKMVLRGWRVPVLLSLGGHFLTTSAI